MTYRRVNSTTILDTNFAAQSNQTLNLNQNYTIDGKVWTKRFSANDQVAMNITNGEGLIITPNSGSNFFTGGTFFLPGLDIPLSSLHPKAASYGAHLRIWIYYFSDNPAANFDLAWGGVYTANSNSVVYCSFRGFSSGLFHGIRLGTSGGFIGSSKAFTPASTPVTCIDIPNLGIQNMTVKGGSYPGGNFPAYDDDANLPIQTSIQGTTDFVNLTPSNASLWLSAMRAGSRTSYVVKIGRIKVELIE